MYDNFKVANYDKALLSPEMYARAMSRLWSGDIIDGFTVIPGTGLQVVLQPGNGMVRYGSTNVASARIVSLVDNFNLAIGAPDGSNPRNDLVVLYIDNSVSLPSTNPPTSANLDGLGVAKAKIVQGTPNSTPTDPTSSAIQASVGSGNPYTVLARVRVDTGVSVIASDKITSLRTKVSRSVELGEAVLSSNFTSTNVSTDAAVPGLSVNVTIPTGIERVEVIATARDIYKTATGSTRWNIWEGSVGSGTIIGEALLNIGANNGTPLYVRGRMNVTPGEARTFSLGIRGSGSAGTIGMEAGSTYPAIMSVKGIG